MKNINLKVFFIFPLFISSSAISETLEEALTLAYEKNPIIKLAEPRHSVN